MSKLRFWTLQACLALVSAGALAQTPRPTQTRAEAEAPVGDTASSAAPRALQRESPASPRPTTSEGDDEYLDFSLPRVDLDHRPRPVGAVFAEFGLGVLGIGLGTGITIDLLAATFWRAPDGVVLSSLIVGGVFTFALADAGIYAGGELTGGRGSSSWTALGILLGAGVGTALGLSIVNAMTRPTNGGFSDTSVLVTTFTTPGLGLVGGIVAYELSDRAERRRLTRSVSVVPVAAPMQHGISFGLAGRF